MWSLNPWPATPLRLTQTRFGLLPVRSPLLGEYSLFVAVLRCFSSRAALGRGVTLAVIEVGSIGLPHSDTQGSSRAGRSPWRFAANYVLLRHLAPRHPPCALSRLTVLFAALLELALSPRLLSVGSESFLQEFLLSLAVQFLTCHPPVAPTLVGPCSACC